MDKLLQICYDSCVNRGLECDQQGDEFSVKCGEDTYSVSIEETEVLDNEKGDGTTFAKQRFLRPPAVKDHVTLLDQCMNALYNSEIKDEITDITLDGDHKSCDAIFCRDNTYFFLTVA